MRGPLKLVLAGLCVAALLGGSAFEIARTAGRDPKAFPVPTFNTAGYGWFEIGDDFLPPHAGAGPVTADPQHPYFSNQSGKQPTYRVADLRNPILKPWVAEKLHAANEIVLAGKIPYSPRERCWPAGVPAFEVYTRVRPVYFVQQRDKVLIVNEGNSEVRRVYLNVPHQANVKPSWYGDSVGHYENGDTLVVDTIGLSDKTFVDNYLTAHTEQLHVMERFTITEGGKTLDVTVTVDDPGAFNTPWSARQVYHLEYQGLWDEAPCADNNDVSPFGFDLMPIPKSDKADF